LSIGEAKHFDVESKAKLVTIGGVRLTAVFASTFSQFIGITKGICLSLETFA